MRGLVRLVIACLAVYAFVGAVIVGSGLREDVRHSDVAVVLGSKVNPDGRASLSLALRLDTAVTLYRQGAFPAVIVSGGIEPNGTSEAEMMKAYLVARGVPAAAVITDAEGATTRLTAVNTAAAMQARGYRSVLVISQYFHIPRCRLAMAQAGVAQVRYAPARFFILRDLFSIQREVAGYVVYLVNGGGLQAANR